MRVKIIRTGALETHDGGYAARLIEQGKAIPTSEPVHADKAAPAKVEEKKVGEEPKPGAQKRTR